MKRNYEGTTRLQGIGECQGIKAINVKVGDYRVWNFGSASEVVRVEPSKTGKTVKITTLWFNNHAELVNGEWVGAWEEDTRTLKADTIVVVKELNPAEVEAEKTVEENTIETEIEELEELIVAKSNELDEIQIKIENAKSTEERHELRDIENNLKWEIWSMVDLLQEKREEAGHFEEAEEVEEVPAEPQMKMSAYEKWLRTFIEEKGLDLDSEFTVEHRNNTHFITLGFLIEVILKASKKEQEQIQNIIVQIDFKNGDVMHFFNHLAHGYIKTNY